MKLKFKVFWYSFFYYVIKYRVARRYKKMTPNHRLEAWTRYEIEDHWTKNYWFGIHLSNYILLRFIEPYLK